MSDIVPTPGSVVSAGTTEAGTAGATVTAGQPVYKDAADSLFKLSSCNSATAAVREVYGIALNNASINQPLTVHKSGLLTIGTTVVVGKVYVLSANAGGIAPSTDLASGWYTFIIGIATTTGIIKVGFLSGGVAVP